MIDLIPPMHLTHNKSFLVRIWREGENGPWRASVQDVRSGEKRLFATLELLCLFLLMQEDS